MSKKTLQYTLGYIIGGSLVLIIIPYGLSRASQSFDHLIGIQLIPIPSLRLIVAAVLLLFGLLLGLWSNVVQNTVGKGGPLEFVNIEVSPKTQNLVVTGPYRYTRNPMLFGTCVLYCGIAIYLNSLAALAIVVLFTMLMLVFVKLTEERRLLKEFGSDYEEYRQRVSMFFPWVQKQSGTSRSR